ncbi:hypothetical protein [Xenorhabdus sp. KJ12.1]|uniref:hypothetical protein n=1 Tax=Xenorhabdus sp. KJ12.1 TaxID=1851571 RepID=UPI000C03F4EF|nr:hypothetical protein [Xenorhabdus sp. KJ12.1]PHM72406.1 hypothetical protein Xekj_00685 [Xenorhabdus sp. KJ12.1]
MKHIYPLLILVILLVNGCSNYTVPTLSAPTAKYSATDLKPTALQVLKDAGVMIKDDYQSAEFIPNSDEKMIVAKVRDIPCKMIFRYITTSNGNYWMPNQIACSP